MTTPHYPAADAAGYFVRLGRLRASPTVSADAAAAEADADARAGGGETIGGLTWLPLTETDDLLPIEVANAVAPDTLRAKVAVNLAYAGAHAWQWPTILGHGDRLAIFGGQAEAAVQEIVFDGHVAEVDMAFDRGERVVVTAVGRAARLARDFAYLIHGRVLLDAAGDASWATGLPATFNAAGRPNRAATIPTDLGANVPGSATEGFEAKGVPVFTYDGDPSAVYWSPIDAFHYLLWRWNTAETWIWNPQFTKAEIEYSLPRTLIETAVEGMSLWAALAAVSDRAGYDVAERVSNDGGGKPLHNLDIVRRHAGRELILRHQAPAADGTMPAFDRLETTVSSVSLAESSIAAVPRPHVLGGLALYEVTVPLGKAWNATALAVPADEKPDPNASPTVAPTYYARYCTGGASFATYRDVGRLWDANTDGRYTVEPYECTVVDVGVLCGSEALAWPAMPHRPRPCLSRLGSLTDGVSAGAYVEISFDAGSTWQPLPGAHVLGERLGVWLAVPNLAAIVAAGETDDYTANLFYALANAPADVHVRLTCTVAAPYRHWRVPDRTALAGTPFEQSASIDRSLASQVRLRTATSRFTGTALAADECTEAAADAALLAVAQQIQSATEDRLLSANLPLNWPDSLVRIGDCIEQIQGIHYDLRSNCGGRAISPRVVATRLLLEPGPWSTQLTLDTDRKSGVT